MQQHQTDTIPIVPFTACDTIQMGLVVALFEQLFSSHHSFLKKADLWSIQLVVVFSTDSPT